MPRFPPAEAEENYYRPLASQTATMEWLELNGLHEIRGDSPFPPQPESVRNGRTFGNSVVGLMRGPEHCRHDQALPEEHACFMNSISLAIASRKRSVPGYKHPKWPPSISNHSLGASMLSNTAFWTSGLQCTISSLRPITINVGQAMNAALNCGENGTSVLGITRETELFQLLSKRPPKLMNQ
jgi:hypothetical protein